MATTGDEGRRVLRRCGRCRLLFEVEAGAESCIVCGAQLAGLALPITEPVPSEMVERERTERRKTN